MNTKIKQLIESGEYDKALLLISDNLNVNPDLSNPQQEEAYKELIGLRIAANSLMGQSDVVVLDAVRQKRFVAPKEFLINKVHKVTIYFDNLFSIACDAHITSIHADKLFDVEAHAATNRMIELLGKTEIQKQLKKQLPKKKGDFVCLEHKKFTSPLSYHILCYEGERDVDIAALAEGLRKVLQDAMERKLKHVALSALGIGILRKYPEIERPAIAEAIANKIAETIVLFYWANTNEKSLPQVSFGFVDPRTTQLFENVFYHYTKLDRNYYEQQKKLSERERVLIERVGTKDADYSEMLRGVNNFIDEDSVILIGGETGVGKSMLAETIHRMSARAKGRFVQLNCAAARPELVYSTLFGSEKGAYTGAGDTARGYVEEAQDGTLFLDEIGEADFEVQRSLLTFLDSGKYRRLRGKSDLSSNAKVIFGTNKDLQEMVKQKRFMHDLYERLDQRVIYIPSLRKRPDDIEVLVESMMEKWNLDQERKIAIDKPAIELLSQYNWPGNVRQLSHYLEMRFHDSIYDKSFRITKAKIEKIPPRNELHQNQSSPLGMLENIISDLLKNPEGNQGMPLKTILESIAAKVYVEDLHLPVTKSSEILGIDGSGGTESTLKQRVKLYKVIQNLINKIG